MRNRKSDIALIIFCLLILSAFAVFALLSDSDSISQTENRTLSVFPKISSRSLASGELFEELSAFINDRFPLRQKLIEANAVINLSLGQKESNGVFLTEDGSLVAKGEYQSLQVARRNIDAIKDLLLQYPKAVTLILPRACDVNISSLPPLYDTSRSQELISLADSELYEHYELKNSVLEALKSVERPFYSTDHHWTSEGVFSAYGKIASYLGEAPKSREYFTVETASEDFLGTLSSKAAISFVKPDRVLLYRYENDDKYIIINRETEEISSFYSYEALEHKDKYKIFLGGNFSFLSVRDSQSAEKPRLLLVKDSFANALVPLLAIHFDIDIIDPRYCDRPIESYVDIGSYDKVLILFGADTLATTPMYEKIKPSKEGFIFLFSYQSRQQIYGQKPCKCYHHAYYQARSYFLPEEHCRHNC